MPWLFFTETPSHTSSLNEMQLKNWHSQIEVPRKIWNCVPSNNEPWKVSTRWSKEPKLFRNHVNITRWSFLLHFISNSQTRFESLASVVCSQLELQVFTQDHCVNCKEISILSTWGIKFDKCPYLPFPCLQLLNVGKRQLHLAAKYTK